MTKRMGTGDGEDQAPSRQAATPRIA